MAASSSSSARSSKHHLSCGISSSLFSNKLKGQRSNDISSDHKKNKSRSFKQFNIVDDYSDHFFAANTKAVRKPSNVQTKKIQQDWKILSKDLPETIFVRVYEERIDLLRAVIMGPAGTPYHDGLFFFDFQFTDNYPNEPPKAHYHSGGLRLNPNLYADGTVCLSLLNTWYGKGCEKWDPKRSTMLQILISIQGLVLNAKPYFNEPGYAFTSSSHQKKSLAYNESTFLLSCRTMMYSLRRPPRHFMEFVSDHFCKHGLSILMACRAYSNGTQVGCGVGESDQVVIKGAKVCSEDFKANVKKVIDELLKEFTARGVNCKEFLAQNDQEAEITDASTVVNATDKTVTGADSSAQKAEAGDASALPKKPNSKLKHFGQYLLKLGKKVLPIDN